MYCQHSYWNPFQQFYNFLRKKNYLIIYNTSKKIKIRNCSKISRFRWKFALSHLFFLTLFTRKKKILSQFIRRLSQEYYWIALHVIKTHFWKKSWCLLIEESCTKLYSTYTMEYYVERNEVDTLLICTNMTDLLFIWHTEQYK